MARSSRFLPEGTHDFFVTGRCHNKEWFKIPMPVVWDIFSRYLWFVSNSFDFKIRAFVLMSNHYHMLVTAPSPHLSNAMRYLAGESAKEINRFSGRINQVWGRPYHSSVITSYIHYLNVYKYLMRNPAEAGLCRHVEEYPFCSLSGLIGTRNLLFPVIDQIVLEDVETQLQWLNTKPEIANYRELISVALRRRTLKFGTLKSDLPHPLDKVVI